MGKNSIVALIVFCMTFIQVNGCTVIGYSMGKMGDANSPQIITITRAEIVPLNRDTPVKITLADGNEISGKFIGFKNMLSNEYKIEYDRLKTNWQSSCFVGIGDTIEIHIGEKVYQAEFISVDYSYIHVLIYDFGKPVRLPLSAVNHIMFNEKTMLEGRQLMALIDEGTLPVARVMIVDCKSHREYIFMHNIDKAQYYKKSYSGKLVGGLLGVLFDILVLTTTL